jgi:hypothetical protein
MHHRLAAACAALGALALFASTASTASAAPAAPRLGPSAAAAAGVPSISAAQLPGSPAGYYRVATPGGAAPATTVYWMPRGSAAQAPAAIKATAAYRDDAAAGLFAGNDVTFYGAGAASVSGAESKPCPQGWFCLYREPDFGGRMLEFHDTYWQRLADWDFEDRAQSIRNHRDLATELSAGIERVKDGWEPRGERVCFNPQSETRDLGSFNRKAEGIGNSKYQSHCG